MRWISTHSEIYSLPGGQEVLQTAMALSPRPEDFLRYFQTLVRSYPEPLARAALEIAINRRAALAKFPQGELLYFTRESLEQASAYAVAAYRARRYRDFSQVADLGCSAGGDTLALAAVAPTVGIDRDADRLALASANLQATGLAGRGPPRPGRSERPAPPGAWSGPGALF